MLSNKIRLSIIGFLLRRSDFLLVVDTPYVDNTHEGIISETVTAFPESSERLSGVIASCMEHRMRVTELILDAALRHLKRYEVDCKNFIQKLYEND